MKPFHPNRGFTLIELLIVIVVVAVLATLAAPNMSDLIDKRRAAAAGEAIYGLIQTARSEAIKQSETIRVVIDDAPEWVLSLRYDDVDLNGDADDPVCNCQIRVGDAWVTRQSTSTDGPFSGVSLALTGDNEVAFDLRGLTTDNNGRAITVTSERGWQTRIIVNPIGRVTICAPDSSKNAGAYRPCN